MNISIITPGARVVMEESASIILTLLIILLKKTSIKKFIYFQEQAQIIKTQRLTIYLKKI